MVDINHQITGKVYFFIRAFSLLDFCNNQLLQGHVQSAYTMHVQCLYFVFRQGCGWVVGPILSPYYVWIIIFIGIYFIFAKPLSKCSTFKLLVGENKHTDILITFV